MDDWQKDNYVFAAIIISIVWFIVLAMVLCISGCTTTRITDGDTGREAIYTIGKLESEISNLDRRVEGITDRAEDIERDVGILEELLTEYIRHVQSMRTELINYRERISKYETQIE